MWLEPHTLFRKFTLDAPVSSATVGLCAEWHVSYVGYSLCSTLCLLSDLGQQYVMRFDRSKRLSASKTRGGEKKKEKKTGYILTPDNRCCHSEPIIVSIMKSVGQKRGALSFPYSGPSFLCIPLFIRSRLLITVLFASESRMPYNLLPQKHPSMQMKWPKKEGLYLLLWPTVIGWV